MKWRNTQLVFRRELCDQWRDRRTIFTIVVMPLVLYPLMGMGLLQTAQFMRPNPARVAMIGSHLLKGDPELVSNGKISESFVTKDFEQSIDFRISSELEQEYFELVSRPEAADQKQWSRTMGRWLRQKQVDLLVVVEPARDATSDGFIQLWVNSANERSADAATQIKQLIRRWRSNVLQGRISKLEQADALLSHYDVSSSDVAPSTQRGSAMWAKLLPFILLVWALTGAFYPAIDVCAGEKERGTLETLLSSPARRSEIVGGKLLTVITFSAATALLNLISMGVTGLLVSGQLASVSGPAMDIRLPPLSAFVWLLLGLLPVSALFSALALALAAFARSSKEGQYYLIPLLMSLLPLMMLSMLPSAKLDLGTSLIPITGLMLLLRSLITAEYALALQYFGPVLAITLVCCWLAARWAVYQFNNESVLFRSGEQLGLGIWIKHLVRDRGLTPTVGEALLCGVIILVIKFFVGLSAEMPLDFGGFAKHVVITQGATILLPAVLLALFLTRSPRQSLKIVRPRWSSMPAFMMLAILLHPLVMLLSQLVMHLYPPSAGLEQVELALSAIFGSAPNIWAIVLVVAVVPAICEEVAFRGFILSGLQSFRGNWAPIVLSSLLFGAAHGILQQSILAAVVGSVLGVIAVKTRSVLPCILYHATHNALPVLMNAFPEEAIAGSYMGYIFEATGHGIQYTMGATIFMPLCGLSLLFWWWKNNDRLIDIPVPPLRTPAANPAH